LTLLLLAYSTVSAQAPATEWFLGQGTDTEEHVHEGMQTSDGGYIAIGHGIESSGSDDMLIIKVDEDGVLEWQQNFGTAGKRGSGYCIAEMTDGYIAGGAIYDASVERTHPVIGNDGTIYVGGGEAGNLYAIRGSAPLTDSHWPRMQRDNLIVVNLTSRR